MAIVVSYNAYVKVNGVDLSNHVESVVVNDGQDSREVTAMGNTVRTFRAGLGNASIEITFLGDVATGSVEATIRPLITLASTGFEVIVKKDSAAAVSASNPFYNFVSIIDGTVNLLDEKVGEVSRMSVKFMPYSNPNISTTTSA